MAMTTARQAYHDFLAVPEDQGGLKRTTEEHYEEALDGYPNHPDLSDTLRQCAAVLKLTEKSTQVLTIPVFTTDEYVIIPDPRNLGQDRITHDTWRDLRLGAEDERQKELDETDPNRF